MTIHNQRTIDGSCRDCGARREEIEDNLAPTCEHVTGPNRLLILAARRELRSRDAELMAMRREMQMQEERIVGLSQAIREKEAEFRQLIDSHDRLVRGE